MNLAEPGEPLKLADGTEINPQTGDVVGGTQPKFVEVPNNKELRENYAIVQRRLEDLPLPSGQMNGISIILMYKMVGLPERDIAVATGLTIEQVGNLVMSDAFTELQSMVVENMYAADKDEIRTSMRENAIMGVQRMQQLINSDNEGVAFAAAKDSLDRDGHRPNDIVEHRHKMEGGLTIEVIKKDRSTEIPTIDAEYTDIIEGEIDGD